MNACGDYKYYEYYIAVSIIVSGIDYVLNICDYYYDDGESYILFILLSHEVLEDTLGLTVSVVLISFFSFTHLFIHLAHMY